MSGTRRPSGPTGGFVWPSPEPIGSCDERRRACVRGRIESVRSASGSGPRLTVVVADGTGELALVFLGRGSIGGMAPGAIVEVEGMVGRVGRRRAMRNPRYRFVAPLPDGPEAAT